MTITLSKPAILLIATLAALAAVVFFVGVTQGGDLEPPNGPDMGTTQIPPTWHQNLPADDGTDECNSSRYRCVLPTAAEPTGEAVLDNSTGLVWQRAHNILSDAIWSTASFSCYSARTGNVFGWRLPKIEELRSLEDPMAAEDPKLYSGHPFIGITDTSNFWSATTKRVNDLTAYFLGLDGDANNAFKTVTLNIWCVRGGDGYDGGH